MGTASPAGFWCWHMPGGLFPPLVWVRTSNQSEANYHRSQGGESLSRNLQPIGLPHHPAYLCHSPQADVFLSPQQTGQDCGNLYKAGQAQQQQHLTSTPAGLLSPPHTPQVPLVPYLLQLAVASKPMCVPTGITSLVYAAKRTVWISIARPVLRRQVGHPLIHGL